MTFQKRWTKACPQCRSSLENAGSDSVRCRECGRIYPQKDGVWRFLPADRLDHYSRFLTEYACIRRGEGRGSDHADYYLKLPECDSGDPLASQWKLRKSTWNYLRDRALPLMGKSLMILDLGAGVGWLSHRLSKLSHRPCAVDLNLDRLDGLGAARHYRPKWPLLQAEFDRLPLADASADVAIYNASLHYSVDYRVTLREALRTLRPGGWIAVLETPVYRDEESGQRMAEERHGLFEKLYGTRSDALPSREYLTWAQVKELGQQLNLTWMSGFPWYGWKWFLRPLKARLTGAREPAAMPVLLARKPSP